MSRRIPRFGVGVQLAAFVCAVAGLGLLAARADDGPDDRSGKRAEWAYEKTMTVDLGRGVSMEFVLIPPGKFLMGSPPGEEVPLRGWEPHEVEITRPFYLAKYLMTQEQYEAVTGTNPSHFSPTGQGMKKVAKMETARFPVETVSWEDAQSCCAQMTEYARGRLRFRLPTEAEWEYACRARTTTPFHCGAALNGAQANCDGNSPDGTDRKGPSLERTTQVGSYPPNAWGLYDMHGNVWQWCEDYYGPYRLLPAKDPVQKQKQSENCRILRGGSWGHAASYCRAAYRYREPDGRYFTVGFRVAFRPE
jgi:formylglycine-generating enzyme required for sulfatase activity